MTNTPSPDEDRELIERLRARKVPVMAGAGLYEYEVNERSDELCDTAADRLESLLSDRAKLEEALEFYADPENYHAISFMCDQPCGSFEDDFDENHGHEDYDRAMPGKRARAALNRSTDRAT